MQRHILFLLLLIGLIGLVGCTWLSKGPPLEFTAHPTVGHPSLEYGGLRVTFNCTGSCVFTPGDGAAPTERQGSFRYTYTYGGVYQATATSGTRSETVAIHVWNEDPYVGSPYWTAGNVEFGITVQHLEKVTFMLDPRTIIHGCEENRTVVTTGIEAIDGDSLEVRFTITREDGTLEKIFIHTGDGFNTQEDYESVANTWIPLQDLVWFANWVGDKPAMPFGIVPDVPESAVRHCVLEARDPWGGYDSIEWDMYVIGGCN